MDKKNYIVYKISNKVNDKIYIGCHVTENINDNYMGSGTNIKKAINEFGVSNFEKIILYNFDEKEDMLEKERQLVNKEFISREDTYNIIIGGGFNSMDTISVKDVDGNCSRVHKSDPRYLSGELMGVRKGDVTVKDIDGNTHSISIYDPRYLLGELVHISKGKTLVKDKEFKYRMVYVDSEEYSKCTPASKDIVPVKDKNGNFLAVSIYDPRYLSGELKHIWCGRKHTDSTKRKIGEKNSKQKGVKNSQYGTCWIYNSETHENKKIKKEELTEHINNGWVKGRKIKK